MSFHEVRINPGISYGAGITRRRRVQVTELSGGGEERQSRWVHSKRRYAIDYDVRDTDTLAEIIAFWEGRNANLYGFRLCDPSDCKSCLPSGTPAATDQAIGTGDGTTTVFQLAKSYQSGTQVYTRTVHKPVVGTVRVAVDGVTVIPDLIDHTTGEISFATAPETGATITAGYEYDMPVRFDREEIDTTVDGPDYGGSAIPLIEVREITPADADQIWLANIPSDCFFIPTPIARLYAGFDL